MSLDFFFFQAEDGIRDKLVTGVQTCALPISAPRSRRPAAVPAPRRPARARTDSAPPAGPAPPRCTGKDRPRALAEIGRASCRERVKMSVVDVSRKKKEKGINKTRSSERTQLE